MDSVAIETRPEADERFDTARTTAAVDALAAKHAGREDLFRSAVAQLLKAELIVGHSHAPAVARAARVHVHVRQLGDESAVRNPRHPEGLARDAAG